ncbi:hypothetical protein CROQUDRAFT_102624 [Cronartium quercuum f. sp. fusiforme G11]|uniref:Uncharacterized protein n=1 Tax=Cronartium quercuum f. sp. fusiforme G11 TaxID=708437 RepID=A0A9P6N7Z4_9BASI|nr:hypothetical protein CROQUDRAFT_102624 [Cronartium quercuum f. sp. fusiforme G11]
MAVLRFFWFLLAASCYTFRIIPHSETQFAQRITNLRAVPYGERTFLDEVPLISAIKRDYHLHDPKVAQQVKPKGTLRSVRDYITKKWRAFMSTEMTFYYDTSKKVQLGASNMLIRNLAQRIQLLGLMPVEDDGFEGIRVVAHRRPQPVIYMALAALEQNDLPLKERLWALGALAGLEKYFSSIKEGGIKTDIFPGPLSRGELELSLIQTSVRELWNGSGLSDTGEWYYKKLYLE